MENEDPDATTLVPALMAEFADLHKILHPLIAATEKGEGETVRLCLDVPKEQLLLFAYLSMRMQRRAVAQDGTIIPGGGPFPADHARLNRWHGKRYIERALYEHFGASLRDLAGGYHPLLHQQA